MLLNLLCLMGSWESFTHDPPLFILPAVIYLKPTSLLKKHAHKDLTQNTEKVEAVMEWTLECTPCWQYSLPTNTLTWTTTGFMVVFLADNIDSTTNM